MATYATQADVEAYSEGLVVDDAAAFGRLLDRAERDVNRQLVGWPDPTTGLRIDVADLEQWQRDALARAVAAQVEYRLEVGEKRLAGGSSVRGKVKGPDFEIDNSNSPTMKTGPKVRDELVGTGLLLTAVRASP